MRVVRRLNDSRAGFIDDVSEIIALEAWKDPTLIPDLSSNRTIFVFSDYSEARGYYRTYSFYVFGRSGADYFNGARKILRQDFRLGRRRMSFKNLNDRVRLRALPAFLDIAGAIDGFVLTFAVDSRIPFMFANDFLKIDPDFFGGVKKRVLEDILRVAHFGALAVMIAANPKQNVVWFTDTDQIVANERSEQLFGKLAEVNIRRFFGEEGLGAVVFGITSIDDASRELEDFAAVPDLVAGALCETLTRLARESIRIRSKVVLNRPKVTRKTDLICDWISKHSCPLKKFGVVFDKFGSGEWDWRPTFFAIRNAYGIPSECCGGQKAGAFLSDPVRFDVANLGITSAQA